MLCVGSGKWTLPCPRRASHRSRAVSPLVKADACWLPIAAGLTPYGLWHSYKTLLIELSIPVILVDEQMGHLDGSIQTIYSHVTRKRSGGCATS